MAIEIVVPQLGESVTGATVAKWLKGVGDAVEQDEPLVELETDKVTLEVNAPQAGKLGEIVADQGAEVEVGAVLGRIAAGGEKVAAAAPKPAATAPEAKRPLEEPKKPVEESREPERAAPLSPAVRKLVEENVLDPGMIPASGRDGRLTKGDVIAFLDKVGPAQDAPPQPQPEAREEKPAPAPQPSAPRPAGEREERVRMSRLRRRVAERLKVAQNTAAMLTTFNECDMGAVMEARKSLQEGFEKRHGVRLGFMSFFVKAAIVALHDFPAVNAEIDGDDIVYKNHYDIGVAVGTEQGLVVPVIRDADAMSFAAVEKKVADLGKRARDGKLTMDELQGGTFTITNGGVYGSLMSTPILNPPQSGILGMHKIQQRPMVMADGSLQARPMMYLALSYDHRIVDGREAVSFLVRIKECIEDPRRILLEI